MRNFLMTLIAAFCGTSLIADGNAACFAGWDMTLGIGFSTIGSEDVIADNATSFSEDVWFGGNGSVAIQGKIGTHYDFCDNWLLGLSGYAQYNNADFKQKYSNAIFSYTVDRSIPVNLGVELRTGYAYCSNQLLYVGLSADWAFYQCRLNATGHDGEQNLDIWHVGPRLLGGAEQRVCGKLILKEEFSYAWYNTQNSTVIINGNSNSLKRKPSLPTFMFSAGYLF